MSTFTELARHGYRLGPAAGVGGGGQVYRAWASDGSAVAIKVGHADDDLSAARAAREAAIATSLPTTMFPGVHRAGRLADGRPWLAMEWIDGDTLAARLGDQPWSATDVVAVGAAIARALVAAHARGVVHRDVKPDNVMFRRDGRVVLVDLGLARRPDDAASSATRCAGTPSYMAPEQVLGEAITPSADLYGLGGILYRLLAGHDLFEGGALEIQLAHLGARPRPLPASTDPRTRALQALVLRLLGKRPCERPTSAAEVLAELARLTPPSRRRQGIARASAATLGLAAAAVIAAVAVRPPATGSLAWEVPTVAVAPAPPATLDRGPPWAMVSAGDYTLRASWPATRRAGDRLAVRVEVWNDEETVTPKVLAATLRDPTGKTVALTGATLGAVPLVLRGDYLLTVFAPDGDITLAVPIWVGVAPTS